MSNVQDLPRRYRRIDRIAIIPTAYPASVMWRALVRRISRLRSSARGLGAQQGNFFSQFHDRLTQLEHRLVLFRNVTLQVNVPFLQFGHSF